MTTDVSRRKYKNSPLVEVVCEIDFNDPQDDPTIPGYFHSRINKTYPKIQRGKRVFLEANENDDEGVEVVKIASTRFLSEDENQIVQLSRDVLTINSTHSSYTSYEDFAGTIKEVVQAYLEATDPKGFKRLRLRYINFISISAVSVDLKEYFNYYPIITEDKYDFELQVRIPPFHENHELYVKTLSINVDLMEKKTTSEFIIDLNNLYVENNLVSLDFIEAKLREAHENIGRIFEKLLTNKTRALLEEDENETCNW